MAIKIRDAGALAVKYMTNATTTGPAAYKAGVQDPRRPQNASALAAVDKWQAAVTAPAAKNRLSAGLRAAGDAGWTAGALSKGVNNYAPGVTRGKDKWQANVTPYLAVLAGLSPAAKGIRGSAGNYANVTLVGNALHNARVARAGGP